MKLYEAKFTVTGDKDLPTDQLDELADQVEADLDLLAKAIRDKYPSLRIEWTS